MGLGSSWLFVVFAGAGLALLALLVATRGRTRFGRLPGDVRYGGKNVRVYAPVTSMLVLSIVLSLLLSLLAWLFG